MEQAKLALSAAALAAQTILECSGEIYRAEETAIRMCEAFGLGQAEIMCFPTGFMLCVQTQGGESLTRIKRVRDRSIQLQTLDEVNTISRASAAQLMTPEQALHALEQLRNGPRPRHALMALAYAASAGFFSVMFGGGWLEFLLTFLAGGLTQGLVPLFRRLNAAVPLVSLACGFVAAASSLVLLGIAGGNQEAVISGAIMPLLPGLAITNAVRDTMRGDLVAGMARTTEALLSAVLLAAGVAVALML